MADEDHAGRKRRILIWMVVAIAANAIFDVVVGLPYDDVGFAIFASTGVAAFFAFAWVRVDTQERSVKLGAWGPAVLFVTKVALPAYFVLSRGWRRGLFATAWMFILIAAMLAVYVFCAEATVLVMGRFTESG